jgi:hypothetical protein
VRRFAAAGIDRLAGHVGVGAVEHDYRDRMTIRLGLREEPVRR